MSDDPPRFQPAVGVVAHDAPRGCSGGPGWHRHQRRRCQQQLSQQLVALLHPLLGPKMVQETTKTSGNVQSDPALQPFGIKRWQDMKQTVKKHRTNVCKQIGCAVFQVSRFVWAALSTAELRRSAMAPLGGDLSRREKKAAPGQKMMAWEWHRNGWMPQLLSTYCRNLWLFLIPYFASWHPE